MSDSADLIIPFAKKRGVTSFSSLSAIKKALGTKKVGHTGTLDKFADGLLVLLSGKMTKIAPYIVASEKQYLARIQFGSQTDSLDPEGSVVQTAGLPTKAVVRDVCSQFIGTIMQQPPQFSAIKVAGCRSSDRVRSGQEVILPKRAVSIYELSVLEYEYHEDGLVSAITIRVRCSKGTYIRSLARDIAQKAGSCAYVSHLRREAVGPFMLKDAVCVDTLGEFSSVASEHQQNDGALLDAIRERSYHLTRDVVQNLSLGIAELREARRADFKVGKKMDHSWFLACPPEDIPLAVFCKEECVGLIEQKSCAFSYKVVW